MNEWQLSPLLDPGVYPAQSSLLTPPPPHKHTQLYSHPETENTGQIVLLKFFISVVYSSGIHFGVRSEGGIVISLFF